ncbi:MAG: hypothetical protein WC872_03525 [Candidatus Absconditabacterales bacterium]
MGRNKKRKNLILVFVFVYLLQNIFSFSVYAINEKVPVNCESSNICGSSSDEFNLTLNFMQDILNTIKTIGPQGDWLGKYVNPNWFDGNKFSPPDMSLIGEGSRNISQKISTSIADLAIFTDFTNRGGIKDESLGIIILAKNKIFLRDRKKLEEMDRKITAKKYELGVGGGWYASISQSNLKLINSIIAKYVSNGLLIRGELEQGIWYQDVTSMLTRINSALKSFLFVGKISQFDHAGFVRGINGKFTLKFNFDTIQRMDDNYSCASGIGNNKCNTSLAKFNDNIKLITQATKDGSNQALKTIKDASQRFAEIFTPSDNQEYKDREKELLNSYYGNRQIRIEQTGNFWKKVFNKRIDPNVDNGGLESLTPGLQNRGESILNVYKTTASFFTGIFSSHEKFSDAIINYPSSNSLDQKFSDLLKSQMQEVLDNQKSDQAFASLSEIKDITFKFNLIGIQIANIKNVVGGKDKKKSLIYNLGKSCELQCSNVGGKCRY